MDGRIRYTKMILKQTFLKLLENTPLENMTVKELCAAAEINRATFYRHYDDCYDLMDEIESEMLDDLKKLIAEQDSRNTLQKMLAKIKENKKLYCLLCSDKGDRYLSEKIIIVCYKQINLNMQKLFPNFTSTQREWIYRFIAKGCGGILELWINNGAKEPSEKVADFMLNLIDKIRASA